MRNLINSALASAIALAMLAFPSDLSAQTRRTAGENSNSSGKTTTTATSQRRSSSATRSSSTSSSQTRSASQQRSATQRSQNSSQTRSAVSSQQRRSSASTTTSSQVRRSTGSSTTATRQSGTVTTTRRPAATVRENTSSAASRPQTAERPAQERPATVRSNSNVTRGALTTVTPEVQNNAGRNDRGNTKGFQHRPDDYRIQDNNVHRIPPRDRGFMPYDRPGHFWGSKPHYFGWRVEKLPPRYRRVRYHGIEFYIYNDVFYRSFGGHYVVCRPPVGVIIDRPVVGVVFAPVRFAFYTNVYRVYSGFDSYTRYIDEQNRTIARNNAIIAAQNSQIAMNLNAAQTSYEIATRLGLAQSYAYANQEYYYEDGIFYIVNSNGRYEVIVPPAGALVDELPDDYDTITLGNAEYYKVDDTVYRTVLIEGRPYLEVLGQMYGSLASRYNRY